MNTTSCLTGELLICLATFQASASVDYQITSGDGEFYMQLVNTGRIFMRSRCHSIGIIVRNSDI